MLGFRVEHGLGSVGYGLGFRVGHGLGITVGYGLGIRVWTSVKV